MKCENCNCEHDGSYGSGRFCSKSCRCSFNAKKVKTHKCNFKHKTSPYGTWVCKFCGSVFNTRRELKEHYDKVHGYKFGPHGKGQVAWNKGLTSETDERVKKQHNTLSERYRNGELVGGFAGKHHSEETKEKLRIGMCNWLNSLPASSRANYNPNSIPILELIAKEQGWNIQHAENGGEFYTGIGYFVDAYDKERNIVLEYDEPAHYVDVENNVLCEKDIIRQTSIIEHLHCEFWRFNEKMKKLWKVE